MSIRRTNRFLVCVTWAHTIFRFFETFFEHASRSKLRGEKKSIFWTYGSKVMDVWSFKEKSGQGGHVLQPMRKSWPLAQKVEGMKKKKFKKIGIAGQVLASTRGRQATTGRRPALGRRLSSDDLWSPESQRPAVGAWSPDRDRAPTAVARIPATRGGRPKVGGLEPASDQQSPAGRGWCQDLSGCSNFFEIFIFF
jgi:hypothetical protein